VLVCVSVVVGVGTFEFSVASYNILAQDLLEEHRCLYGHCNEQYLHWSYRRQNIMRQLNKHNPDVCVCFFSCGMFPYKILDIYQTSDGHCGINVKSLCVAESMCAC